VAAAAAVAAAWSWRCTSAQFKGIMVNVLLKCKVMSLYVRPSDLVGGQPLLAVQGTIF
jgi:hypothetical protein